MRRDPGSSLGSRGRKPRRKKRTAGAILTGGSQFHFPDERSARARYSAVGTTFVALSPFEDFSASYSTA